MGLLTMKPTALRASIAAASLVSILALGAAAYFFWPRAAPRPASHSAPFTGAMRLADAPAPRVAGDMDVLAERLAKRLQTRDPGDGEGWALLGRSYVALGRNDEAVAAFERARSLLGESDAQLAADYHAAKNASGAARAPAATSSSAPSR
jgi:cytochrome c-type biogenesis protein CcmH